MPMRYVIRALSVGFAIIAVVVVVGATRHDDAARKADEAALKRNGVAQIRGQEWPEFTAKEIGDARAVMAKNPVAGLAAGEQQAVLLRTIVTMNPAPYSCLSPAARRCWAALVILSDGKGLEYRTMYSVRDRIDPLAACYKAGDRVIVNWKAIAKPGGARAADILNLDQIRHVDPKRKCAPPAPVPAQT